MPPVPSITKAFSGLMSAMQPKANSSVAPAQTYASMNPAPINYSSMVSKAPAVPALPNASRNYSSLAVPNASYASTTPTDTTYSSLVPPPAPNATSAVTKSPVYIPPTPVPTAPTVQPKAPQTFAEPIVAPSGAKVDPNTGGVVAQAEAAPALPQAPETPLAIANTGNTGSTQNYSAAAGGAPAGASPAMPSLEDEYLKSLKATEEEDRAQAQLDDLAGAAAMADVNIGNQPIALPFITGQQAAVERSRAARSMPIASQLARLQAKRQMSLEASKAALEREDKRTSASQTATQKSAEAAESARRFGIEQALEEKKFAENVRQYGMEYALKQRELAQSAMGGGAFGSAPVSSTAQNIIDLINKGADMDTLIKGTSKESQALRNEVYRGLSAQGGRPDTTVALFKEGKEIVDDMLSSSDYKALGGWSTRLGGQFGTSYGDAMAKSQQLAAILARDNLGLLKGAMSDKDLEFIKAMSTGFEGAGIQSESYLKTRLEAIQTKLATKIAESGGSDGAAPAQMQLRDGTVVTRQTDGTYK